MHEARESVNSAADAVCDGLRYLGEVSYAILPQDIAHALGDLKKAFLNNVKNVIDKEIGWVDQAVAGGDRLRNEWRERCQRESASPPSDAEPLGQV